MVTYVIKSLISSNFVPTTSSRRFSKDNICCWITAFNYSSFKTIKLLFSLIVGFVDSDAKTGVKIGAKTFFFLPQSVLFEICPHVIFETTLLSRDFWEDFKLLNLLALSFSLRLWFWISVTFLQSNHFSKKLDFINKFLTAIILRKLYFY